MANWFGTSGAAILGGIVGKVAGAVNPYAGAAVEGVFGGLSAAAQQKAAKKQAKKAFKAGLAPMSVNRQVVPAPQTSTALVKRTTPSISAGFVGGLGGIGVGIAEELAKFTGKKMDKIIARTPPAKTMFPPVELESMGRAIDLRTKGTRALLPPARNMSNGGNLAVMRRALMGGVTRREAPLFPGSQNWAWPSGMSAVRFGPEGSAHYYRKSRRMNVLNPRALTRSMRRVQGFAKFAKKCITFTARVKMKKGCRKRG
jgi:hypothetical protein